MSNRTFFAQNLWRWKCGIKEVDLTIKNYSLKELQKIQWCDEFISKMRSRMVLGGLRHGLLKHKDKPKHNNTKEIIIRIKLYEQTGNTEYLVDSANICMVEFVEGDHPNKHFKATDDERHVEEK